VRLYPSEQETQRADGGRVVSPLGSTGTENIRRSQQTIESRFSGHFLTETLEVWQPLSGHPLTREEVQTITRNLVGFFQVLEEWDEQEGVRDSGNCKQGSRRLPPDVGSHKLDETNDAGGEP
jgi:hypothetical protein